MKKIICVLMLFVAVAAQAQVDPIYNPNADAKADIQAAVKKAKEEGKHVLIQVGGNWCPWCIKFHKFIDDTPTVKQTIEDNYVFILLNYSKENKNEAMLERFNYPQRFGFPVLLVLDADGKLIHTQASGYLEEGGGYSEKQVLRFLNWWTPKALDPASYE